VAVFGRRQPHAPLILHGLLPPQKPIGRVQIFGQKTAQHSANRYFYRSFSPIIKRAGGQPATARALIVQRQAQTASQRPFRRGVFVSAAPPAPVISAAPVGKSLLFGVKTSQAAADRYFRRRLTPTINRAGGRPAVAQAFLALTALRTAADRYARRSLTPVIIRRVGSAPSTARSLIVQRQAQTAAQRPVRRPIWISPAPPAPVVVTVPIGKVLLFGQKTAQHAADRFYRRAFPTIIKRAGGVRSVARTVLIGQKTGQLAADRYFRRSFPAIIKRAGGQPAVGRLAVYLKVAQTAARRPGSHVQSLASAAPPVPPPPVTLFGGRWTPPRRSTRWTAPRLSNRWTPPRET
jgi:hypothetical protein